MFITRKNGLISAITARPGSSNEIADLLSDEVIAFMGRTGDYDSRSPSKKRADEFPSVGDMIDAICKKNAGDSTEYDLLEEKRQEIKAKHPTTGKGV